MVTCEDILRLRLDGVSLVAGENSLDRMVSWTYMVQTRPIMKSAVTYENGLIFQHLRNLKRWR